MTSGYQMPQQCGKHTSSQLNAPVCRHIFGQESPPLRWAFSVTIIVDIAQVETVRKRLSQRE